MLIRDRRLVPCSIPRPEVNIPSMSQSRAAATESLTSYLHSMDRIEDGVSTEELCLPEDILQPLFRASEVSNLREALEVLIENSRTHDGRADLASKDILPAVLKLTHILNCSGNQYLMLSLKLLRNLCAIEIANRNLFVELDVARSISDVFKRGSEPDSGIIRLGLQVLANFSSGGGENQQVIWRRFFPDEFVELAKVQSRGILDPLCMIIYTCCDGNPSVFVDLIGDQGLPIVAQIVGTAAKVGFGEDWLKLLLSRVCLEENYFPQLFSGLYCVKENFNPSGDLFSAEQAYLLSIVSEILSERLKEITVSIKFALFVLDILEKVLRIVDFSSRCKSGLPTGSALIDVLGYSITILRDICAQHCKAGVNEDEVDVVDKLISRGLLDSLLSVLAELEPPAIIKKAMKQNENQEEARLPSSKHCPYEGFRRDIVAVIGNCTFLRKNVQDEIRRRNGIMLLLQQCVTDEENPFLREWGIWSVRNLLEGNAENQQAVAELELQKSVDVPELAGLGLRVQVDPETRRARLVNMS